MYNDIIIINFNKINIIVIEILHEYSLTENRQTERVGMSYVPRRWSSYRSLAEQDEITPEMKEVSPDSLLDNCIGKVLRSSYLAGEAGRVLPTVYAHYILYLAMKNLVHGKSRSYVILHRFISSWSHPELSFNFQSNRLVQSHLNSSWRNCLTPPYTHYGIKGIMKSRFGLFARDIAIGLFNHVYYSDLSTAVTNDTKRTALETVDLSEVQFAIEPRSPWSTGTTANAFFVLARGDFPGRAAYECLSPEDFLYIGAKKPTLQSRSNEKPITVYVNLDLSSKEHIELFQGPQRRFKIRLKVLDMSKLDTKELGSSLEQLDLSDLCTLIASGSQCLSSSVLSRPTCVWLLQETTNTTDLLNLLLTSSKKLKDLLINVSNLTCAPVLETIASSKNAHDHLPNSLSVFGGGGSLSNYSVLGKCLSKFGPHLDYLHLVNWTPTLVPSDKLAMCENLQVLSIVGRKDLLQSEPQMGDVFKVLSSFKKLEYLELYQNLPLKAPDLIQLGNFLKGATKLIHCHINFSGLTLKRADLDVQTNTPIRSLIRLCLGSGARGNSLLYRQAEHFSFKLIKGWLKDLRPDLCFELDYRDSSMFNDLVHFKRYFF